MRRHVLRVCGCRCDLRVAACGGQGEFGEGRVVVTVNQVMSDSGMLRLKREDAVQDLGGFLLPCITLIRRHRSGGDERQGVEHACFVVGWVELVYPFHRIAVSKSPRSMIEVLVVLVESLHRRYVSLLARCSRRYRLRLFNSAPTLLQLRRRGRSPERMVITHSDAPVAHATLRVHDGNFRKSFLSLFVFKRMKPRDCMIELRLRLAVTGYVEIHPPEFFCSLVWVWMHLLRSHRGDEQENCRAQ